MITYLKILRFFQPYKWLVIFSVILSSKYVLMNSLSIWMIGTLIATILNPESALDLETVNTFNNQLKLWTNNFIGSGPASNQLKSLCIVLFAVFVFKNITLYLSKICLSYIQSKIVQDIRNKLFEKIHELPISFFKKYKTSELVSIITHDVYLIRTAFIESLQSLLVEPFSIIIFIFLLFIISPKMAAISVISIIFSSFIIFKLGKDIRKRAKLSSEKISNLIDVLFETITNIKTIRAFSIEKSISKKFVNENLNYFKLSFSQSKISLLSSPLNDMIGVTVGIIVLWFGGLEVLNGKWLKPDDFMRFILLLFAIMHPAKKLGHITTQIQAGIASAERVFNVINSKNKLNITNPILKNNFKKQISFNNVFFSYTKKSKPILSNINFTINKGEKVALVGKNGAGKTTLIDLMARFYDTTKGTIKIDDIDIKNLSIKSLRTLIGIVPQNTMLFNDSIKQNIKYGNQNVTFEKIKYAAKVSNVIEFVSKLPNGFNTIIGPNGINLSAGQQQCLSIARTILKNPKILILDEPTSSLDIESENQIQKAMNNLIKDKTVITIAHKLSTIIKSDKIIVLRDGKVVEQGHHEQLINRNGEYKYLYYSQFQSRGNK